MAKYSELPSGAPAQSTDLFAVARGSTDVSLRISDIAAAAPVQSVAGRSGAVVLAEGDVTNLTADLAAKATAANLTAETARATAAESTNATAITTETTRAQTAEALLVPKTTTVNGHALSAPVVVSASDLTTGTLPHAQLPALLVGDIPALPESGITNLTADLAAKEVTANKDTDVTLAANSDTKYPSQKAIKAYVDGKVTLGIDAAKYGVTGNGAFRMDAVIRFFALTQVSIVGSVVTYTGTITGGAANAFANYKFAIAGFVTGGNNLDVTITASTATTLVCALTTQVNETHAATAGSYTVDCPTGNFNTNATVGQIAFATSLSPAGFSSSTLVIIAQGTIAVINSNTQIVLTTAPTQASASVCLVWGDDETLNLINAWAACTTFAEAPSMLILPGENPQKNGPAVILVQKAQLNSTGTPVGTGGARNGLGATGGGQSATYIVPTPNFDTATVVGSTCFLNNPDGAEFSNFTISGMGNGRPGVAYANLIGAQIFSANNAFLRDMAFLFWGGSTTNGMGTGLQLTGQIVAHDINVDGFGQVGIKCAASGSLGAATLNQCSAWDNGYCNLYITGANPVFTNHCSFGASSQGCSVNGGGVWVSTGDTFGVSSSGYAAAAILVGYTNLASGVVQGAGTATMIGARVICPNGSDLIYLNTASDFLTIIGCTLNNLTGAGSIFINNNGSLTDGGGNLFTTAAGSTPYSGTGVLYGALSITGAPQVSGNIGLTSGWGTGAAVSAVSGNTRLFKFTVTVGTTPGASPVLTLTFPTKFLVAPICRAGQTGGNNPWQNMIVGAVTTSSVVVTWNGTPVAGDTLIIVVEADLP